MERNVVFRHELVKFDLVRVLPPLLPVRCVAACN